jgi:hypothetical protein
LSWKSLKTIALGVKSSHLIQPPSKISDFMSRIVLALLCAFGLLVSVAMPVAARAETYVAGDSIGMGVGMVSQLPSVAAISIAIRGPKIIEQLRAVPAGSTVFLSLGTNDAVSNLVKGGADLDRLVAFVRDQRLKLYWIGPPCVLKPWDESAKKLDESLRADLARTGITYVGMRAQALCDPAVRAKDGIHFTMTGYRIMWQLAAEAANFKPVVQPAPAHTGPAHAVPPKKKRKKPLKKAVAPAPSSGTVK